MKDILGTLNKCGGCRHIIMLVFIASAAALMVAGCSDEGVAPVTTSLSDNNDSFFDLPWTDDALAKRKDIIEAEVSIAQSRLQAQVGGVIALGENVNIESFIVLPFSIPSDTTFTVEITKITTTDGEMPVVYEFGPDGLVFDRPAVIRLDLGALFGKNVSSIDMYWLDETTNEWVLQDTYDADSTQVVYAPIEHFSSYAYGTGGTDFAR